MKKVLWILAITVLPSLFLSACEEGTENTGGREGDAPKISESLGAFLDAAPAMTENGFGDDWFYDVDLDKAVEIPEEHCNEYIHGKTIQQSHFSGNEPLSISDTATYYYISKGPGGEKYSSIIFSTLEIKNTLTYLCTYSLDGEYVDGIVLHGQVAKKMENGMDDFSDRTGDFQRSNLSMIHIHDKIPQVGAPLTTYSINEDGKIVEQNRI